MAWFKNIDWVDVAIVVGQAIAAGGAGFAMGGWPGAVSAAISIIIGKLQGKSTLQK